MSTLRSRMIRLAHLRPELRPVLLPLLKTATDAVEKAKMRGHWNIVLRQQRSWWDISIENPQGGGGSGRRATSAKAALQVALKNTNFEGADKAWVIYATMGGDGWEVTKAEWVKVPPQASHRPLTDDEKWDMQTR